MGKKISQLVQDTAPSLADRVPMFDSESSGTRSSSLAELAVGLQEGLFLPEGGMWNGYISRTVTSNNITVAIKTMSGSDPSTDNPVVCRIGNSMRVITSALSVTLNAGTNWFNSGSSTLATYEIDYFTYLGWRASNSSVFIGFARIPYALTYGAFSTTNTNQRYLAYSGAAPASTDEVEVVGRFNATLSATASFNWSVPATSVIVNRPIFETRVLSYTSGVSASSGSITTASITGRYRAVGELVELHTSISVTNNGTGAGGLLVNTGPFTSRFISTGVVREVSINGWLSSITISAGGSQLTLQRYDNTYPAANGCTFPFVMGYLIE